MLPANGSDTFSFTHATKLDLHTFLLRSDRAGYQFSQPNQVLPSEVAPAGCDDNERVWGHRIGPTGWKRAQRALGILKVNSIFAPVVAIRDQLELLASQRMMWVYDFKDGIGMVVMRCS